MKPQTIPPSPSGEPAHDHHDHAHEHDSHEHGEHCDHDHGPEHHDHAHKHEHHHHDHDEHEPHHHGPGCGHDHSPAGLKIRLTFVFAATVCLVIHAMWYWLAPLQAEVAAIWSMAACVLAAVPIIRDTIAGVRMKAAENTEFYMNQFITLAVVACFVSGRYTTGGIVAIILLVGHILEDRTMLGASQAIDNLLSLTRTKARRMNKDGSEEEVDAEALQSGDLVLVRPGDTIPADGTVEGGFSSVNQASITGESLPVEVESGAKVFAGTSNLTGALQVRVTNVGDSTVLGRVHHIVEEAQTTRAPIIRLTEEYARYYMPLILIIAGFVLFFTRDLERAISVFVVAIPCTFVMAGPTAMVAALATASRLGILIKSVRFFEAANEVDTVVFDKTGTLTTGQLNVMEIQSAAGFDDATVLAQAASIEQHSSHPVARALVRAAQQKQLALIEPGDVEEAHGLGVAGRANGNTVVVGRPAWLTQHRIEHAAALRETESSHSELLVAIDGVYAGSIFLADTVRGESQSVVARLEKQGIEQSIMLTGDRPGVAQSIAAQVGITEFKAGCLPEQKLETVTQLKAGGKSVLVVGDGVNDAPALAAGNLSMAMGALGSDVAIQTADIALMSSDLRRINDFLALSDRTLRVINQNMLCGLLFVGIAIVLSGLGYIPPVAAAFLHEIGAFFVIFNSARLLRFEQA
jgi:Cd2+/Zn2+-exporting ATPase